MRGFAIFALGALLAGPAAAGEPARRPCPSLSADAFAARLSGGRVLPGRHFRFGGTHFARASGKVRCIMAREGRAALPTCRFSNPQVLQVTTPNGRFNFLPGPGAVTVTVRDNQAVCVMAG